MVTEVYWPRTVVNMVVQHATKWLARQVICSESGQYGETGRTSAETLTTNLEGDAWTAMSSAGRELTGSVRTQVVYSDTSRLIPLRKLRGKMLRGGLGVMTRKLLLDSGTLSWKTVFR